MKIARYFILLLVTVLTISCGSKYKYETVKGDPMRSRIYTLDNGLKVYLSVNKDEPRIQTYIAVRVGSKNDPAETTGLSHYLEHIMFKGTSNFGTTDYETEKPMLDEIERLFEVYRVTAGEAERTAIYAQIDSISYAASKIAVANEYDKIMSAIGAQGTNAYTSNDCTVYVENIPSNQIENWLRVEADRFKNPVIRGFHTELEAVYEEKNISLSSDYSKIFEQLMEALYPNHPYGTQSTLGTVEHLKNPSITNIKNHLKQWYVPNNIAICMSGDFDPDTTVALIDKYFGDMQPNDDLPGLTITPETPITTPKTVEVVGNDQEFVIVAWRQPGARDMEVMDKLNIMGSLLSNGKAGLMDVNLNSSLKVLYSYGGVMEMKDYSIFFMIGAPTEEQTLEEVRDLMLDQMELIRNGEFDETMFEAIINNHKLNIMNGLESNWYRADLFVNSFVNETDWKDYVGMIDRLSAVTKEQVVEYANETMTNDNYVVAYKRYGKIENPQRMPKPLITPIEMNRDMESRFLTEIKAAEVAPIAPVFVDFNRDMDKLTTQNGTEILYKRNQTTGTFGLDYVFETGGWYDPRLSFAFDYIELLGTDEMSNEEIMREFYNIACSYGFYDGDNRSYIYLSGLGENMDKAMELLEKWVFNAKGDDEILGKLKDNEFKGRSDVKLNRDNNASALRTYSIYGADYVHNTTLTNEQIAALTSDELLALVRGLFDHEQRIVYYGPDTHRKLNVSLANHHYAPETPAAFEADADYPALPTDRNKVYVLHYDAPQTIYMFVSNDGTTFNPRNSGKITMFNEYFGGGMNSVVFQELREARGLAYSAWSAISQPSLAKHPYVFMNYIGTQNDKLADAIDAFNVIVEDTPMSDSTFATTKEAEINAINTERIRNGQILWSYIRLSDLGLDYDYRKDVYAELTDMTIDDLKAFHDEWIKGRTYTYAVVGDTAAIDMKKLESLGEVIVLDQKEVFGY